MERSHDWKDTTFVKISTFLTQVRLEALHSRLRLSCIMADKMSSTHKVSAFLLQTPCYLDPHHWVAGPGQLELPCGRKAGGIPTRESRLGGYSHSMCHLMQLQLIHTVCLFHLTLPLLVHLLFHFVLYNIPLQPATHPCVRFHKCLKRREELSLDWQTTRSGGKS